MSEKKGVKELKELLDLALAGVECGVEVAKDGKVNLLDLAALLPVVQAAPLAFQGVGEIPGELADLDAEEGAEVVAHVMAKLAVDDAKAAEIVAASLKVLVAGHALYKAVKA